MSDTFIRHLISFIAVLIAVFIYVAAYVSGTNEWWWTILSVVIIYPIVYKLVDV